MTRLIAVALCSAFGLPAARTFAVNTDVIDMGSQASHIFSTSQSYTITGWVRHSSVTGTQTYVRKNGSGAADIYVIRKSSGSKLEAIVGRTGGPPQTLTAATTLSVDTWYFFAFVRNVTSDTIKLYLATATGSVTQDATATDATTTSHGSSNLIIGRCGAGCGSPTDENFLGRIAYVTLWDKAMTIGDLESIRWNRLVGPNRIGFWPMDGSATEPDLSGSNKPGTVTGATVGDNPPVGPSR